MPCCLLSQPSSSHISTMDASSGAASAAAGIASFPPQEAAAMQPSAMQPSAMQPGAMQPGAMQPGAMPPAYHFLYSQLAAAAAAQQGGAAPSAAPSATAATPSACHVSASHAVHAPHFPSNALATDGLPRFDFTPPPNVPSAPAPQPTAPRPQGTAAFHASSSQHAARQAPDGGSERSGSTGAGHEPALARRTTTSLSLAAGLDLPSPAGGPRSSFPLPPRASMTPDLLQQAQAQLADLDQSAGANLRLLGLTLPSAHSSLPDQHPLATPPPSAPFHAQASAQQQQQQASPQSPQLPLQVLMQLHGLMHGPAASAHPTAGPLSAQQQSPAQVAQALALALGGGGEGGLQAQGGMHGGLDLGAGMMGGSSSAPGTGAGAGGGNGGPMGAGMVGMDGRVGSSAGGGVSSHMRQGLLGGAASSGGAVGGARGMGGFGGMGDGVGSGGCGQGEAQLFPQQWMAGGGVHTPMAAVQAGAARSNGGVSPSSALSPQSAPPPSAPLLSPHAPLLSPRSAQHRSLGAPGAAGAGGEAGGGVLGRREAGMGGAGVGGGAGGKWRMVEAADGVLCKVRAKRGQATHPRSIAERVSVGRGEGEGGGRAGVGQGCMRTWVGRGLLVGGADGEAWNEGKLHLHLRPCPALGLQHSNCSAICTLRTDLHRVAPMAGAAIAHQRQDEAPGRPHSRHGPPGACRGGMDRQVRGGMGRQVRGGMGRQVRGGMDRQVRGGMGRQVKSGARRRWSGKGELQQQQVRSGVECGRETVASGVNAADMLEDAIEYVRHLQRQIEVVQSQHPDVHIQPFVSRLDSQQGAGRVDEAGAEATDWDPGARGDGEGEEEERGIVRNGDGPSARGGAGVEGRMDDGGLEAVKDEHTVATTIHDTVNFTLMNIAHDAGFVVTVEDTTLIPHLGGGTHVGAQGSTGGGRQEGPANRAGRGESGAAMGGRQRGEGGEGTDRVVGVEGGGETVRKFPVARRAHEVAAGAGEIEE
ncbi:unnamed protein product [Closterium sp. Naga37s-1]|nr:unnamed protein product [Closterium sp. Naga37s-1]